MFKDQTCQVMPNNQKNKPVFFYDNVSIVSNNLFLKGNTGILTVAPDDLKPIIKSQQIIPPIAT